MKIKATHSKGILDLSSSSVRTGKLEIGKLRLVLNPGEITEIDDGFRNLPSIDDAISKGKLKVLSYDNSNKSFTMQEEFSPISEKVSNATSLKDFSTVFNFSSETSKDSTISINGANHRVIRIRMYINQDPGSHFFQTATLRFFTSSDRKRDDILWEGNVDLIYTELDGSSSSSDNTIDVDDASDFSNLDLFVILDNKEYRRIESISSNTITMINSLEKNHSNDSGVSRVAEVGSFSLFDEGTSNNLYINISFDTSQTVSIKMDGKIV